MLKYVTLLFISLLILNRLLHAYDEYKRLSLERETDINMWLICNGADYRSLGRHAVLCAQLEHRLSQSVLFYTVQSVINNTLYREFSIVNVIQLAASMLGVVLISVVFNFIATVLLKQENMNLPRYQPKLKYN